MIHLVIVAAMLLLYPLHIQDHSQTYLPKLLATDRSGKVGRRRSDITHLSYYILYNTYPAYSISRPKGISI